MLSPLTTRVGHHCRRWLSVAHNYKFDSATAVTPSPTHDGTYKAFITDDYNIVDSPNGGYLMCIAISAARGSLVKLGTQYRDPLTVTGYYFSKCKHSAEVDITVDVLHSTRSTASAQVTLRQGGALR